MTTATKRKAKPADPLDELRAADDEAKAAARHEYETVHLPTLARRNDEALDRVRVHEILRQLGMTIDDVERDVIKFRKTDADIRKLDCAAQLENKCEGVERDLVEARAERDELVAPLDEKIRKLEASSRQMRGDIDKQREARHRLLSQVREVVRTPYDELKRQISNRERHNSGCIIPDASEALWQRNQWVPLNDSTAARAALDRWRQREREFKERQAAERAAIKQLKKRLLALEHVACTNPWPTEADVRAVLEACDAEEQQIAEAESVKAQASAAESEARAIESL